MNLIVVKIQIFHSGIDNGIIFFVVAYQLFFKVKVTACVVG